MPVKKTKKPRARRAPAKKKGLKQKQKQRQEQKVNVSVSAGGSAGGTQFIPMPSAPAFDYAQLAQLIRPANTVDVPIRAQANPEPIAAREAGSQTLAQEFPRPQRAAPPTPVKRMGSQTMFQEEESAPSADMPITKPGGKVRGRPSGSKNKPKPVAYVVQGGYESDAPSGSEYERMREAQKSGSFM